MPSSQVAYTLLGLTAVVAALVAVVVFAFLRFAASARDLKRGSATPHREPALMSDVMAAAIARLRDLPDPAAAGTTQSPAQIRQRAVEAELCFEVVADQMRHVLAGAGSHDALLSNLLAQVDTLTASRRQALRRVDLDSLLARVVAGARQAFVAAGGDVLLQGHFPAVVGDGERLHLVFDRLVNHARGACAGSGIAPVVTVHGRQADQPGFFCVCVDDNRPAADNLLSQLATGAPAIGSVAAESFTTHALVRHVVGTHAGRLELGTSAMGGASVMVMLPIHVTG